MAESPSDIMADVASISSLHQPLIVPQLVKDSSRVDVELFISEFREELGPSKWKNIGRHSLIFLWVNSVERNL